MHTYAYNMHKKAELAILISVKVHLKKRITI